MKYAQLVFTKVLSSLFQQKAVSAEKRKQFLKVWMEGVKNENHKEMRDLLYELSLFPESECWKSDINRALESI